MSAPLAMSWSLADPNVRNVLANLAVVATVLALWLVGTRTLARSHASPELRLRIRSWLRNFGLALVLIGMITIWAEELQSLLFSLVAIAAAIAIAGKELIANVLGSLMRTSIGSYTIGDRIRIGEIRGDVVDVAMTTTTLLEVGPGPQGQNRTGRQIVVPNGILLTTPVLNESRGHAHVLQLLRVELEPGDDPAHHEALLLKAGELICGGYIESARRELADPQRAFGLVAGAVQPRVLLALEGPKTVLYLRYPALARARGAISQALLRCYLELRAGREPSPPELRSEMQHGELITS